MRSLLNTAQARADRHAAYTRFVSRFCGALLLASVVLALVWKP